MNYYTNKIDDPNIKEIIDLTGFSFEWQRLSINKNEIVFQIQKSKIAGNTNLLKSSIKYNKNDLKKILLKPFWSLPIE